MSNLSRSSFYETVVNSGVNECDFLKSKIFKFKFKRPFSFYTVKYSDLARPDVISYKLYDSVDYWWLIMYVNDIVDPWNELEENDVIKVPNSQDVLDWLMDAKNA
jgi:hypothetical protein